MALFGSKWSTSWNASGILDRRKGDKQRAFNLNFLTQSVLSPIRATFSALRSAANPKSFTFVYKTSQTTVYKLGKVVKAKTHKLSLETCHALHFRTVVPFPEFFSSLLGTPRIDN